MKNQNFLEEKAITKDLITFRTRKITRSRWALILILSIMPSIFFFWFYLPTWLYIPAIPCFVFAILISPFLWKITSNFFLRLLVLDNLKVWKQGKEINPISKIINSVLGLDVSQKKFYYLEAIIAKIDLNSLFTVLKDRVIHVSSACIGITFAVGTVLSPSGQPFGPLLITIFGLSPLILGWLIPIIWTLQDSNVKYVTQDRKLSDLGKAISNSFVRRILGIAGYLLAFGFILDRLQSGIFGNNTIDTYILAGVFLLIFVCVNIGTSFIISSIYLNLFHEKVVNTFRTHLAQILNVNNTSVKEISDEEKKLFTL